MGVSRYRYFVFDFVELYVCIMFCLNIKVLTRIMPVY